MRKIKIKKIFLYDGTGFPVYLLNVPMAQVRDVWTPDVNYNEVDSLILQALAFKPARLTGLEIRFIRHYFEMTTTKFASRFDVSFAAVLKWEKTGKSPTKMNWTTEKDVRLFILSRLHKRDREMVALYNELEEVKSLKPVPVRIDVGMKKAAINFPFPAH